MKRDLVRELIERWRGEGLRVAPFKAQNVQTKVTAT